MTILDILSSIIFFLIVFLIIFIIDYYFLSFDRKKKKKIPKMTSMDQYILTKFNINPKYVKLIELNFHMAIINSFIIAFVSTVLNVTNFHIVIKLGIAFLLLLGLIYSLYEIYGRYLKRKINNN